MSSQTVIAATDLSPRSEHVAGRAAHLAVQLGARLVLVHVGTGDETRTSGPLGVLGIGRAKGSPADRLSQLAQSVGADARLLSGPPDVALAALAQQEDAALIVLGLHRVRGVLDLLRLTTMERIVLAAPCPVLIAHQSPDRAYQQVLAPTDFTASSAASLIMAARIAPQARFHAVHALQLPIGAIFKRGNAETDAALQRAEIRKRDFLQIPGLPRLVEEPEIVPGGVHEVLAFRQQELSADLVCIGALSGRDPTKLGNYARDLMRAPPTDLLVAKPG